MISINQAASLSLLLFLLPAPLQAVQGARHAAAASPPSENISMTMGDVQIASQRRQAVDISGTYKGRIYYGDASGNHYVMRGPVTIEINGRDVTLTETSSKRRLNGTIKTEILPEKANFPVGEIHFDNDAAVEIRWYREGDKLKFLPAHKGTKATRVLRFCSDSVSQTQCKNHF